MSTRVTLGRCDNSNPPCSFGAVLVLPHPRRRLAEPAIVDDAFDLARIASRAAISLDAFVRHVEANMAPVRQLASMLGSRLNEDVGTSAPTGPARLVDPATIELLSRSVQSVGVGAESGDLRTTAHRFVDALRGDLSSLSEDELKELRDFAVGVSIAAREMRSYSMTVARRAPGI